MLAHAALLHEDYNLVLFDFRNHGQSAGDQTTGRWSRTTCGRWSTGSTGGRGRQIALLGVSMGGASALAESIADDRIDAVILDSTHATVAGAIQARLDVDGSPALAARLVVDPARLADPHRAGHQRRRPGAACRAPAAGRC